MDMMASPRTKDGAAMLTSMGINPLRKAARQPSAEQEAATREQAALRKRVRDAEHAQLEADSDLAASDPTPADAASAWRLVKSAADARAQRKLETNNSIAKQRAEDAEAAALQAPEPLTKKTKPAGTGDGHRIKRREIVGEPKKKKKKRKTLTSSTEEMEAEDGPATPLADHDSDPPPEDPTKAKEGPKVRSSRVPMCTYPMHTKHELWKIHSSENQNASSPNDTKSTDKVPGHARHCKTKRRKKVRVLTQAHTLASGCKEDLNIQGEPEGLWISLLQRSTHRSHAGQV
jgi:hypothetical protein